MLETPVDVETSFPDFEPLKLASWILDNEFSGDKFPHLLFCFESFWEFYEGIWQRRSDAWLRARVYIALEDARAWKPTADGRKLVRVKPNREVVSDVVEALMSTPRIRRDYKRMPAWLSDADKLPAPDQCIGFRNCVVDLQTRKQYPRDERWFDPCVVPYDLDLTAECPLWMSCLDQWSLGSAEWKELLRRWFGYCLMNHRRYAKWLLMYEKSRAGKGTIARMLQLISGSEGWRSAGVEDFSGPFALQGFETSKVLSLTEAHQTTAHVYERLAAILKRFLGEDPQMIHLKYRPPLMNIRIGAAPMMQANELPTLPDRAGSISSKLLLLPFGWSTRDPGCKADPALSHKLEREIWGIVRWAYEGACDLWDSNGEFPEVAHAAEVHEEFAVRNSPADLFLDQYFSKNIDGYVSTRVLWACWKEWAAKHSPGVHLSESRIRTYIKENSSWSLRFYRPYGEGRGLSGLSLKVQHAEEDD